MDNRLTNTELIGLMRDLVLADYEYSRSYQNFLQTSREYFTSSTTNIRMLIQLTRDLINGRNSTSETTEVGGAGRRSNFSYFNNSNPHLTPNRNIFNSRYNTIPSPSMDHINPIYHSGDSYNTRLNNSTNNLSQPMYRPFQRRVNRTSRRRENEINIENILSDILTAPLLNPRNVIPTAEDISNNCTTLVYGDISSNQNICPIDRIEFSDDDVILKINHCGHIFKKENLLRVFERNSKCPLCRHDILERNNNESEPENNGMFSGSDSFIDHSGNNISLEYTVNYI